MSQSFQTLLVCVLLLALANLPACIGTSTGNPADGGGDPIPRGREPASDHVGAGESAFDGRGCLDDERALELEEVTELGFSAADILAFVEGAHEETITWHPQDNARVEPERGDQALTITVEAGEIRYVDSVPDPDLEGEIAVACQGRVEIDATVTLQSAGGALDETLELTLQARSELLASAFVQPDPNELGGALTVTPEIDGFTLAQIDLQMSFTPFGNSGSLDVVLEKRTDDAVTASAAGSAGPLASWGGAGACDYGQTAVGLEDEVLNRSGREVLDLLDAADSAGIVWDDGSDTRATLAFTPRDESVCVQLEPDPWGGDGAGRMEIGGTLDIESEDLRLSASWPVLVTSTPGDDGPAGLQIGFDWRSRPPEVDWEMPFGFSGLDTADLDGVWLDLSIEVLPDGSGDAILSGSFTVHGSIDVPCEPALEYDEEGNVVGSGSCPGGDERTLAHAELGAP